MDSELINPAWNKEEIKHWASYYLGLGAAEILYANEITGAYLLTQVFDEADLKARPFNFIELIASNLMTYIIRSQTPELISQKLMHAVTRANLSVDQMTLMRDWLSRLLEKRIISHEDSRFDFPIPVGIPQPVGWTSLHKPPFFNREPTLLALLNDCYANFSRSMSSASKPIAAFIATAPGFGKTRLLLEWAIRVFHDTRVLNAFWNGKSEVSPKDQAPPFTSLIYDIQQNTTKPLDEDKLNRARFIGSLYRTLKQSSIISASADILNPVHIDPNNEEHVTLVVDIICRKIMGHALCSRFGGKRIEYANKSVEIPNAFDASLDTDKEWLADMGLLNSEGVFFSLFRLFMAGIDLEHKSFSHFGDGQLNPRIVLVNIDESQSLMKEAARGRAIAYYVMQKFYQLSGTKIDGHEVRIHVLMVGLVSKGLEMLQDRASVYTRIALPLDPLLSLSYCNTLCQNITQQPLDDNAQNIIRVLWKKSLGIPRAIQILHHLLDANKTKLVSGEPDAKKEVLKQFMEPARLYFSPKGSKESATTSYSLSPAEWDRLVVEASFCVPKKQTDTIGNTTYSMLESEGAIFPFKFGVTEELEALRYYTMPFHFYGETLAGQIDLLKSEPKTKFTKLLMQYIPSIGDIVGPDGSQTDLQVQGKALEKACSVSLWARYRLNQPGSEWCKLSDLIKTWPSQDHYVTKFKIESESFAANLDLLKQSRSIIINEANSAFADVLIPILKLPTATPELLAKHQQLLADAKRASPKNKGLAKNRLRIFELEHTFFLLVQCRNVIKGGSQISPSVILNEWSGHKLIDLMNAGHLYVLLSPNLPTKPLNERARKIIRPEFEKFEGKWIEANGRGWLSDLFMFTYSDDEGSAVDSDSESEDEESSADTAGLMSPIAMPQFSRKRKISTQGGGTQKKAKSTPTTYPVSPKNNNNNARK